MNLDSRLSGLANPFLQVTVHTHFSEDMKDENRPRASQGDFGPDEVKQPIVWQTKVKEGTLDPQWQEMKTFKLDWRDAEVDKKKKKKKKQSDEDANEDGQMDVKTQSMASSKPQKTEDAMNDFALTFPAERIRILQAEAKKWKDAYQALYKLNYRSS